MNRMPLGVVHIGFVCMLAAAGCASEQTARQPTSADSSVPSVTTESASVGPSDSLKACLAKIPSDSSNGMRMIAEQSCQDNEKLRQGVVGTAIAKSGNRASAGTQGDSLKACLARIPTDATSGQRMLAEETCARDQLTHR
ncbi:MAG: hypothetical protein AB7F94_03135 [Nitrospira sp.]